MKDKDKKYLMPVGFGAAAGPRQRPDDAAYEDRPTRITRYSVRFETDRSAIEALLPAGLSSWGEPLVTIELAELRDIAWLAGRGYNTLGVRFPARFEGQTDRIKGQFLAVLWENLTDPIITGREQLGYPKIYANISDARRNAGRHHFAAHWLGFSFLEVELEAREELAPEARQAFMERNQFGEGLIQHKYIPHTGEPWQEAAADYFTYAHRHGPQSSDEAAGGEHTRRHRTSLVPAPAVGGYADAIAYRRRACGPAGPLLARCRHHRGARLLGLQ